MVQHDYIITSIMKILFSNIFFLFEKFFLSNKNVSFGGTSCEISSCKQIIPI